MSEIVLLMKKLSGVYGRTALATDWIMETLGQIDILRIVLFIENYEFSSKISKKLEFLSSSRHRIVRVFNDHLNHSRILGFTIMIMALKVDVGAPYRFNVVYIACTLKFH